MNSGDIETTESYEGMESAVITMEGGSVSINSDDDGLNVAGGADQSDGGGFSSSGNYFLYMRGGSVYVNSQGDGVDVNGSVVMTGGVILVNGPATLNNGAVDYDGFFKISGGFVLATGSSGMRQIPGASSTQNSVLCYLSSTQSANALVHVEDNSGNVIFTFKPVKQYQSVAFSSPSLSSGTPYMVYAGGTATGEATHGLYADHVDTPGALAQTFTISSVTTQVGSR